MFSLAPPLPPYSPALPGRSGCRIEGLAACRYGSLANVNDGFSLIHTIPLRLNTVGSLVDGSGISGAENDESRRLTELAFISRVYPTDLTVAFAASYFNWCLRRKLGSQRTNFTCHHWSLWGHNFGSILFYAYVLS